MSAMQNTSPFELRPALTPRWKQRSLISPGALGYLYLVYALIAFFVPVDFYEGLIHERYFARLDFRMLLFSVGCVVFYQAGTAFAGYFRNTQEVVEESQLCKHADRSGALIVMALVVIAVNLTSAVRIVQQNYAIVTATLLYGQNTGSQFKDEFVSADAMLAVNPLLILMAWILYSEKLSGNRSRAIYFLMVAAMALSVFISVIKLARYELIPLVIGIAVLKLRKVYQARENSNSSSKPYRVVAVYSAAVVGIFLIFAAIRDEASGGNGLAANAVGYTVASFNRLSAVLDGQLELSYGGSGIYVLNLFSNLPVVGSSFGSFLPSNAAVYKAEFSDMQMAGLYRGYNWVTMYGYYYADLGLWVFPFCFVFGVIAQMAWRSFVQSGMLGTIVYPYIAFALILSFASYWISRPFIAAFAIFIVLYHVCNFVSKILSRGSRGERYASSGRGFSNRGRLHGDRAHAIPQRRESRNTARVRMAAQSHIYD